MAADAILQAALAQHQAGNLDDAARGYRELLKRDPDKVDAAYLLGCLAHQAGNEPAAIGLLRRAIVLRPDEVQFYNALSLALFSSGEPVEARAAIEKAIEIDPQPQFWNTFGTLLKRQGELSAAIDAFRCALEQDASFNEAQYNLGNAYRDLGNLAAGLTCFAAVVARDPKHFHSLAALGQCLLQAQRPTEARGYLKGRWPLCPTTCRFVATWPMPRMLAVITIVLSPCISHAWHTQLLRGTDQRRTHPWHAPGTAWPRFVMGKGVCRGSPVLRCRSEFTAGVARSSS